MMDEKLDVKELVTVVCKETCDRVLKACLISFALFLVFNLISTCIIVLMWGRLLEETVQVFPNMENWIDTIIFVGKSLAIGQEQD